MKPKSIQSAERLVERARSSGCLGSTVPVADFDHLAADLGLKFPDWFRQLFTEIPLCGLSLGWQAQPPDEEWDGIAFVSWATADDIRSESIECYPGLAIRALGYVNVAGRDGSGDSLFICIHDGDDPPLYRVYHDVSDKGEIIVAKGRELISSSLSDFFDSAIVESVDR